MLDTQIRKVPNNMKRKEYINSMLNELDDYFCSSKENCESFEVKPLTQELFHEVWECQGTFRNTTEIKEKYFNLANEDRLIYIKITYNE